jgi:diguanylate cyclase (GGDEF)-like protein/PAS domain S-box-containing protein/putative nucleotidyltransferase with HDIG domain
VDTFWLLFDNTIVFIAMIAIVFVWPSESRKHYWLHQISMGIILSAMAMVTMINSVPVGDGLYIDARYAIPIIAVIFFGHIPGLMVTVTIILARIFLLGGAGTPIGVTYAVIQLVGMIIYKQFIIKNKKYSIIRQSINLLFISIFLQAILLTLPLVFMPYEIASSAITANYKYLLTIYPLIAFLFSLVVGYRKDYYINKEESANREQFFELVLEESPSPIAIYDKKGNFLHINDAWVNECGYQRNELDNVYTWLDLVTCIQDDKEISQKSKIDTIFEQSEVEYKVKTKHNGIRIWHENISTTTLESDNSTIYIAVAKDVTDQKEYENELLDLSYSDFLTGFYNRRYFHEIFVKDFKYKKNTQVIYGDLNNLKRLNDTYGHNYGDEAIKFCSEILRKHFADKGTIFRFGGDEFLLIVSYKNSTDLMNTINKVQLEINKRKQEAVPIGISFGIHEMDKSDTLNYSITQAETKMYTNKTFDLTSSRSGIIDIILTILFEKDSETERHSKRVQEICIKVAEHFGLDDNDKNLLIHGGLLHDIGKILIPSEILLSVDKLTREEYEVIKTHSFLGYRILSTQSQLVDIANIVLAHHEHVDGSGYPNNLKGNEINFIAKILHVIDAFEAMTSNRPYREKKSNEEAIAELIRCSGTQFDSDIVERFIVIVHDLPEYVPLKSE